MKTIEFLRFTHLRGPNIWTYRPVIEAWVDIHDLEDCPSNTLPGFNERLSAWLPTLVEHRCSYGERGGFLKRLEEGTWPAHIMEHVTLELQNLAGMPGGFGRARSTSQRGVYKVVVRAWHPEVTQRALEMARDLVMAAIEDKPFDVAAAVKELHELADRRLLGPSTNSIVTAANEKSRLIPYIRLNDGNLVQLGYGAAQRRIWTAETDRTGAIAEYVSRNKDLTKSLLKSCGVPIPEGTIVAGPAEAWEAAEDIGLPVVVKPTDGNHARGVSLDLTRREDVEAAFAVADAQGSEVMVERYIRGDEHRLLVVGGRLVAAARGESVFLTGDGKSTVLELIESQVNSDPRRGDAEEFPLETIVLEREAAMQLLLERQGLNGNSVPAAEQRVLVQRGGNCAIDCTDHVHPDTVALAGLAARIVGLDIAGIDLVVEDISRPLVEQGGAVVEVNAGPSLLMHLKPAVGEARPVGRAIAEHLFPAGNSGRIPLVGVAGAHGCTLVARLIAHLLELSGKHTGLACRDGLFFGRRRVEAGDRTDWESGQRMLINRMIEAAVFAHDSRRIVAEGLPYDRCLVGVVTRIDDSALLPDLHINESEQLHTVFRTQIDVVLPEGAAVLNAGDPRVAALAELSDGEVIFYARDPAAPPLAAHLARGRRAVFARDGKLILAQGRKEEPLIGLLDLPLEEADRNPRLAEGLLAAVATGWALGLEPSLLRAGLETYLPEPIVA
jgi:cyanophycin synthetase